MRSSPISSGFLKLESKVRSALAFRGLADLLLLLGLTALGSFLLDRFLEIPWFIRLLALAGTLWLYVRALVVGRRRLQSGIGPRELLATVENYDPDLDGHLMNAIELRQQLASKEGKSDLELQLLERATKESQSALSRVRIERSLDMRPVWRRSCLTVLALGLLIGVAMLSPGDFALWAQRNILLSTQPWPRSTHFAIDGETWHQPRKAPIVLSGWVLGEIPHDIYIEIETLSNTRRSRLIPGKSRSARWNLVSMETTGAPKGAVTGRQLTHSLSAVQESFKFRFIGGDNQSRQFEVQVHDRPRVVSTRLTMVHPPHSGLGETLISHPAGEISALEGTRVELLAEFDEPLRSGWLRYGDEGRDPASGIAGHALRHRFTLTASGFLELGIVGDHWGFESKAWRLGFDAVPDREPDISLEIEGASRQVTTRGRIRYRLTARDDFGISALRIELNDVARAVSTSEEEAPPLYSIDLSLDSIVKEADGDGDFKYRIESPGILDLEPVVLSPGMEFTMRAVVTDNDATNGPKSTYSQRETFTVVRGEELLAMLDKKRVRLQQDLEQLSFREGELAERLQVSEGGANAIRGSREGPGDMRTGAPDVDVNSGDGSEDSSPDRFEENDSVPGASGGERNPRDSTPSGADNAGGERQGGERQGRENSESEPAAGEQQGGEQQGGKQQGGEQQGGEQQGGEQQGGEQQGGEQQGGEQQGGKQHGGKQQGGEQQGGEQQGGEQQGGEQQGGSTPRARGEQSLLDEIAEQQRQIAGETQEVLRQLEEMMQTLNDNEVIDPAEASRLEAEVTRPLRELGDERLPRSADDIESIQRSNRPREASSRAQSEVQRMKNTLDDAAKTLAGTGSFRDVLSRLEIILELQRDVIEETESENQDSNSGDGDR